MSIKQNLKFVYKTIVPEKIIRGRADRQYRATYTNLHNEVVKYLESEDNTGNLTPDKREVLSFLKNNFIDVFPYDFIKKYDVDDVEVLYDVETRLRYVLLNGKKLFFKKSWTPYDIKKAVHALLIEQDEQSAHRYLTPDFEVSAEDVAIDIGSAEGNFTLNIIDKIQRAYVIEADPEWGEALRATFAPWKDKVTIITKFMSDKESSNEVTVDSIYHNDKDINLLKIDVEGSEDKVLSGATKLFNTQTKQQKVILCTYHKQHDADKFSKLLSDLGFSISFSDGYMIFIYGSEQKAPYLRKGLIRAKK